VTVKIQNSPIAFSIIFTIILVAFWGAAALFVTEAFEQFGVQLYLLASSVNNIAFTIIAVILFGLVNKTNGFKHTFKANGFSKGLKALIPAAVFFTFGLLITGGALDLNAESPWVIPAIILMSVTSALVQVLLFRGLLITALFVKRSSTEKERVQSIIMASLLFLIIYILFNILSPNPVGLMQLINTFVMSMSFGAAYLYSKNLMSLVLVQGTWLSLDAVIGLFRVEYNNEISLPALIPFTAILVFAAVFAVKYSKRAEPFVIRP